MKRFSSVPRGNRMRFVRGPVIWSSVNSRRGGQLTLQVNARLCGSSGVTDGPAVHHVTENFGQPLIIQLYYAAISRRFRLCALLTRIHLLNSRLVIPINYSQLRHSQNAVEIRCRCVPKYQSRPLGKLAGSDNGCNSLDYLLMDGIPSKLQWVLVYFHRIMLGVH